MRGRTPQTTFIQRLPGATKHFRRYFHLWPIAIEQLDLTGYDLVICNHYSVANGVITGPGQVQISYTHSPMRYAWDLQKAYLQEAGLARGVKTVFARSMLHRARLWDATASLRVDRFMVNSAFVGERIRKFYRRDATVVHPPVFVDQFTFSEAKEDFYLFLGRLVPYKRADLLVEAFRRMPGRKLVIAGAGPQYDDLQKRLSANITMLGRVTQDAAVSLLSRAPRLPVSRHRGFRHRPAGSASGWHAGHRAARRRPARDDPRAGRPVADRGVLHGTDRGRGGRRRRGI